jgi:tRNA A-37 threonylcarbamoyl transferase component Bud32
MFHVNSLLTMFVTHEDGIVVKRPGVADEEPRLKKEAALLAQARHSGVVVLLDSGQDDRGPWIRLEDAGDVTLETLLAGGSSTSVLLAVLTTVATTIADLHDVGLVHGAIDASHVLVDDKGHALLCSFGRGGRIEESDPRVDIAALVQLVEAVLDDDLSPELSDLLDRAHDGRASGLQAARDLSDALGRAARRGRTRPGDSSRVLRPRTSSIGTHSRRPSVPVLVIAAFVAGGVVVVVLVLAGVNRAQPHRRASSRLPATAGVLFTYRRGVLTLAGQRFAVGEAGDQVAVGRWSCGPVEVALLRPNGELYVFDHLARKGLDQEGRLVARAPAATWLRAQPAHQPGCDLLAVGNAKGSAVVRPPAA